jgi:hypothetical protein
MDGSWKFSFLLGSFSKNVKQNYTPVKKKASRQQFHCKLVMSGWCNNRATQTFEFAKKKFDFFSLTQVLFDSNLVYAQA